MAQKHTEKRTVGGQGGLGGGGTPRQVVVGRLIAQLNRGKKGIKDSQPPPRVKGSSFHNAKPPSGEWGRGG